MRALYQWDPSEKRNSPLGNKKKKNMLLRGEKFFQPIKNLRFFLVLGLPQDPKGEGNRLQLTSEQHQTNFQKALKTTFSTLKMVPNFDIKF